MGGTRMSFKAKLAAGAATFAMVGGGLGVVGTLSASAATPPCGNRCISLYPQKYGPHYYVDVYQQKAKAGQESILFQGSNSDPALDFTFKYSGTVDSFYTSYGLVSAAFDHTYGSDPAFEFQYSPYGVNSGFCLSTWPGEAPKPGYKVRLEACGAYSNSLWVVDRSARYTADPHSLSGYDEQLLQPGGAELPGRQPDRPAASGAERPAGEHLLQRRGVRQPGVGLRP